MTNPGRELEKVGTVLAPALREAGFRRKRKSFNRQAEDELVQVLDLQGNSFWADGRTEYRYTVNVGVYVPGIGPLAPRNPDWIDEAECHLRQRLGNLLPEHDDLWWPLDDSESVAVVEAGLRQAALPWLDRFPSVQAVLDQYLAADDSELEVGLRALDGIQLLVVNGLNAEAEIKAAEYLTWPHIAEHDEYARRFFDELGLRQRRPGRRHDARPQDDQPSSARWSSS